MKNVIYDGVNYFVALQGEGKSYVCTHKAVFELLNPKSKRKVLSNFPIVVTVPFTFKQKLVHYILSIYKKESLTFKLFGKQINLTKEIQEIRSSYVWKDDYTGKGVKNALILIDESHDKYTGAYAYELNKDDRKFFSRLRHNDIAVYLMSQSQDDIHPFIRRRLAYIHDIHKTKFFWNKAPSYFTVKTYTSIKNYLRRDDHRIHKRAKKTEYHKERIRFSVLISNSYNTHFFRDTREEPKYINWYNQILHKITDESDIPITIVNKNTSENEIDTLTEKELIKSSINTLVTIYNWKKGEASKEINKIKNEYSPDDINTVDKIVQIALNHKTERLDNINEDKDKREDTSYDD